MAKRARKKRPVRRTRRKKDLAELLSHFDTRPKVEVGDLLLIGEVVRVIDPNWGREQGTRRDNHDIVVATVYPPCDTCAPKECTHPHIISAIAGGQHTGMKLRGDNSGASE